MLASEIRKKFVNFFERHGHIKKASSSLIPQNDPTLLFANAGMNQFKDYFTGQAVPSQKRAVTIQKCVRAGGKHNDLENVGFTARHHTFFEMLGNFSFGDYFKKEAIEFAWTFLTEELKIPEDKLLVTVHHSDDEAYNIWHQHMGLAKDKIFRKGDKDNFWEMGEFGPCGPCSEIFYDHGVQYQTPGYTKTDEEPFDDGGQFVEIWNLVFMQFEKTEKGTTPLPKPSIDTGAGLERIAAATEGKYWNYDTDLFLPIIAKIESITHKSYSNKQFQGPIRVIADHIRSAVMLITDGVIPSNEGRGYVLRRIIRRAVRQLKLLEAPSNSLIQLIPTVFEILGEEYPQNMANQALAKKLLQLEEEKFLETLDIGLKFLNEAIANSDRKKLDGKAIFKLYDTYGFPVDLTQIILEEQGLQADLEGFNQAMEQRRAESRKSWKGGHLANNEIFYRLRETFGKTNFVGYQQSEIKAKLLAKEKVGELTALIFDQTPFYGESGGQAADIGTIVEEQTTLGTIEDVQKPVEDLYVHFTKDASLLDIGKQYTLKIDLPNRLLTAKNHSATHLLQAALIKHLGEHVKQAGSHVSATRLRFDFTHPEKISPEILKEIEQEVNLQIQNSLPISIQQMTKDEAIASGAQALFGEKYGDYVRVVKMGDFSTELCGGTHLTNTADITLFLILHESALSSGIRRIEALTSTEAIKYLQTRSIILQEIEQKLKVKQHKTVQRIDQMQEDLKKSKKELEQLQQHIQMEKSKSLFKKTKKQGDFITCLIEVSPDHNLKQLSDQFAEQFPQGILCAYAKTGDKFRAIVKITPKKTALNAANLLNAALECANGKGGGRNDMAQGSGNSNLLKKFVTKIESILQEL